MSKNWQWTDIAPSKDVLEVRDSLTFRKFSSESMFSVLKRNFSAENISTKVKLERERERERRERSDCVINFAASLLSHVDNFNAQECLFEDLNIENRPLRKAHGRSCTPKHQGESVKFYPREGPVLKNAPI